MTVPHDENDIAVIGLSCRFPGGASDPQRFWDLLYHKRSAFTEVPSSRYNVDAFHHAARDKLNTLSARGGHFLQEDVAAFDAPFFKITAQEATAMDPTARMLLEVTYEALESAGLPVEQLAGSDTSCYVGCFTRDYHEMLMRDAETAPMYSGTGTGFSLLSNRVSWFYDLRGPSMTLDTACSSSLVGLHLACQGLRSGESRLAVVCGANLILSPDLGMWLGNLHMTSTDGLSRSFADGVTGYGRGEGIATVVLKPLRDALRDGDAIRAVIRGSGVNQDGHTTGITLPNREAQADLIRSTYRSAGLDFSQTSFFEAHGTGTGVGDPLELGALAQTISATRSSDDPLYVGSVKSNIGHLEGAAGLAGLIKTVLMLEKGAILPNIHFDQPNKRIPFDTWKIHVPTEVSPWPEQRLKRASLNSFGYGGTNAHVILDAADTFIPKMATDTTADDSSKSVSKLFVFSAHDESALRQMLERTHRHLELVDEVGQDRYLDRLAFTLSDRRSRHDWKAVVQAATLPELKDALSLPIIPSRSLNTVRLGFIFTGQGAQWAQMGLQLSAYPVFRASVHDADTYLTSLGCEWSVTAEMWKNSGDSRINEARISQPVCTVLQVALVELLKSWNVLPSAVVGHSSGEIAAAYTYGALTREEAWTLAYFRGKVCSAISDDSVHGRGAMMALGVSNDTAQEYAGKVKKGRVVVACVNSPSSVTMSGDEAGIDDLQHQLADKNVFCRKLKVEHAYHSHHMEQVADAYLDFISHISPKQPPTGHKVNMVSSVTGDWVNYHQLGPEYWVQNLVSPVLFSDAVSTLVRDQARRRRRLREGESAFDMLLEVGPHCALQGPLRQILQHHSIPTAATTYASVLRRGEDAVQSAVRAAGELFTRGVPVSVSSVNLLAPTTTQVRPLTDLPGYPWNHSLRYWAESRLSRNYRFRSFGRHDLLGAPAADCTEKQPRWRNVLRTREQPWIGDHVVQSSILYPAAGSIAMVLEAVRQLVGESRQIESIRLDGVRINKAIVIPGDQSAVEMVLQLGKQEGSQESSDSWEFIIYNCQEGANMEGNSSGSVTVRYADLDQGQQGWITGKDLVWQTATEEYAAAKESCTHAIDPKEFYEATRRVGLDYGPLFQGITEISAGAGRCLTVVQVPDTKASMPALAQSPHLIHPTTLDVIFHSLFGAIGGEDGLEFANGAVPIEFDSLVFYTDLLPSNAGEQVRGMCRTWRERSRDLVADIYVADMDWQKPKIIVNGMRCRELPGQESVSSQGPTRGPVGTLVWKPELDLMDDRSLRQYLVDSATDTGGAQLWEQEVTALLDLASHKNPDIRILQIGVSDSLTGSLLSVLVEDPSSTMRCSSYTIADAGPEKVAQSREKLKAWTQLSFTALTGDIGADNGPWEEQSFDIIISTQSIAPADLTKYINPRGSLIIRNTGSNPANLTNGDGLPPLPRPWKTSDVSPSGTWFLARQETEVVVPSGRSNDSGIMILVPAEPTLQTLEIARCISSYAEKIGYAPKTVHWSSDLSIVHGKEIISLLELQGSFITDITSEDHDTLKTVMLASARVLWVAMGDDNPILQATLGYLRVLQNENTNLDLRYVKLEERAEGSTEEIARVLLPLALSATTDREYIEVNRCLHINRMIPDERLTGIMAGDMVSTPEYIPLEQARTPLKLVHGDAAKSRVLYVPVEDYSGDLAPDEVEVQVKAIAVRKPPSLNGDAVSGKEFSGVIVKSGRSCSLKPGDRVWGYVPANSYQTIFRVKEQYCKSIPGGVTFDQAALWSITLRTAYSALVEVARLREEQSVLIQGAASPVGQFAIQICQRLGANLWVTVRNSEQQQVMQSMGIPNDRILVDHDPDFAAAISRSSDGKGIDVILNQSLAGGALQDLWNSVAASGILVDVSPRKVDTNSETQLSIAPFRRSASYRVFNIDSEDGCPLRLDETLNSILQFQLYHRVGGPTPTIAFPASQAADFLRDEGSHADHALVLQFTPDDSIPVPPRVANPLVLDPNGTYLIVGGMKGLGANLATLLARSGARHLAIVSRSGRSADNADSFIAELSALGATTEVFAADISDETAMQSVIAEITAHMPPIRGVIQSAAVLGDAIYENMTAQQWSNAIRPKVHGSWILHSLLSTQDLQFFVMLSSISGVVGNRGQANYAAGNTYQDALAAYRRVRRLPAISVDLGFMLGMGLAAERGEITNLKKWEVFGIREREFHLLMAAAMAGCAGSGTGTGTAAALPAQIVTGLPTGGIIQSQGLERPFYYEDPRFSFLRKVDLSTVDAQDGGAESDGGVVSELARAQSLGEATESITRILCQRLARELQTSVENIDPSRPLHAYGVDSLMAVELRTWVSSNLQAAISLFEVLGAGSISALAGKIAAISKVVPASIQQS